VAFLLRFLLLFVGKGKCIIIGETNNSDAAIISPPCVCVIIKKRLNLEKKKIRGSQLLHLYQKREAVLSRTCTRGVVWIKFVNRFFRRKDIGIGDVHCSLTVPTYRFDPGAAGLARHPNRVLLLGGG